MKTRVMFVLLDEKKFQLNLTKKDFEPEYQRDFDSGEQIPTEGDFLYYMLGEELVTRQVAHRLFIYGVDGHDSVILFVS